MPFCCSVSCCVVSVVLPVFFLLFSLIVLLLKITNTLIRYCVFLLRCGCCFWCLFRPVGGGMFFFLLLYSVTMCLNMPPWPSLRPSRPISFSLYTTLPICTKQTRVYPSAPPLNDHIWLCMFSCLFVFWGSCSCCCECACTRVCACWCVCDCVLCLLMYPCLRFVLTHVFTYVFRVCVVCLCVTVFTTKYVYFDNMYV